MPTVAWSGWRVRLTLFAIAVAVWLVCFAALARFGTWMPFPVAGAVLTVLTLLSGAVSTKLLQPSLATVGGGLGAGFLMVGLTHAAYAGLAPHLPGARAATAALVDLLQVGGFSTAARVAAVVVVATCEEVLFRGPIPIHSRPLPGVRGNIVAQVVASSAIYAAACLTLGRPLLLMAAFLCGVAWASLRIVSRSLVAPIIAHVVWDLGVLVMWPLAEGG